MEKNWIGARAFFLMSLIWVLATLGCRLNDNKIRGHIGNSPETPPATPGIEKPFSCADFPEETSYRAFGKGIGADPFLICNPRQLDSLGNSASSLDWDKSYKLLQDIDLSEFDSNDFHLIGTSATPFSGEFDGNGKALSGLSFTASGEDDIGLFRAVNGARIHDLKLDGFYFNGGSGSNVGTLIGKAYGVGASLYNIEIANSEVRGSGATLGGLVGYHLGLANQIFLQVTVHSTGDNVGGFAGRLYGTCGSIYPSTVSHISGNVTIEGGNRVGGLLGWAVGANCTGSIQHSEVGGAVTGIDNVGGMVGFFDYMKSSFNLTSTATVTGVNHVGGALGYMKSTRADQLAAEGDVSASGDFVGGLVGTLYYVPGGV
ncbi:MAG: hypothetical protein KDD35_09110, partial [Bdellovibrionales bacterium]|nr:hypothetical protein [Bdellovibrionales bacterium]